MTFKLIRIYLEVFFYINLIPFIIRIVLFVVLLTCIFKDSNVFVDLILWLVLYVIFRTIYALDKFCIEWSYHRKWIFELSLNTNTNIHTFRTVLLVYLLSLLVAGNSMWPGLFPSHILSEKKWCNMEKRFNMVTTQLNVILFIVARINITTVSCQWSGCLHTGTNLETNSCYSPNAVEHHVLKACPFNTIVCKAFEHVHNADH